LEKQPAVPTLVRGWRSACPASAAPGRVPIEVGPGFQRVLGIEHISKAAFAIHFQFPGRENAIRVVVLGAQGQAEQGAVEDAHGKGKTELIGPATGTPVTIIPLPDISSVDPDLGAVVAGNADLSAHGPAVAGGESGGAKEKEEEEKLLHARVLCGGQSMGAF
jgi:hypothetical protein